MTARVRPVPRAPYLFLAPFVITFVLFLAYPLIQSLWLAFQQTSGPQHTRFIGFENFSYLTQDPLFWKAMRNTFVFAAGSIFLQLPCSLGLALLLNRPGIKGRAFWRLILFSPSLVGLVFVAMIFRLIFQPNTGLVNVWLSQVTGGAFPVEFAWLEVYVMPALILAALWMYTGFNIIYFLAALQNVSQELVEAAMVDGANAWHRFCHIILPAIRPVAMFVVLLSLIGSFQLFELPWVLLDNSPGPNNRGLTVVMYLYQQGFEQGDLGYASAIGWSVSILLFCFALGQRYIAGWRKREMTGALYLCMYTLLAAVAIGVLVPFAYLLCSSMKTGEVFFSSPFLPTSGLFDIEPSTGSLALVDTTHVTGPGPHRFELEIQAYSLREKRALGEGAIAAIVTSGPDDTWTLALEDAQGQPIGTAADAIPSDDRSVQYRILRGNPRGFLGVAWGQLTSGHYRRLGQDLDPPFMRHALNSFFFASVSALLATLCSAMGGFALAKYRFRGRAAITTIVLGCLIVPGAVMLAPLYQLIYRLGLLDTYAGLILPGLAPAFGVFLFRQAMLGGLPTEMMEAARIDGCSEFRMFFVIALPMVRPMISAFLLITYLGAWNNFIWPQIILQTPEQLPLAVAIAQLNDVYAVDYGMLMAGTLISILPVLLLFLLLQKEFIAGLTAGAVKG